jgi:hypothetical protein
MWHRWWPCPECVTVVHPLQVRRFTSATLSDADADRILGDASTALQTNDGPGDVACPVQLVRNGAVNTFATGDGSIDSAAELNAVNGLPGQVKVVNTINWCGYLNAHIQGCAPGNKSFVAVRTGARLEGPLWAHEFGHNKGLGHRGDDPNAIMNGTSDVSHRRVNAAECAAYRTAPARAALQADVVLSRGPDGLPDVREFVRQRFVHGVPYELAHRFPATAVPILLEMLRRPSEEAAWPNIAVTLGMIGDDSAVEPLIAFIESAGSAKLSSAHYAAKTGALMSLGYVVNKTGNRSALAYLKAGLEPGAWAERLAPSLAPFQAAVSERNRDFSKYAVFGLALSGRPEAAQALRDLQRPAGRPPSSFAVEMDGLLSEVLAEHATVAAKGLEGYYRATPP